MELHVAVITQRRDLRQIEIAGLQLLSHLPPETFGKVVLRHPFFHTETNVDRAPELVLTLNGQQRLVQRDKKETCRTVELRPFHQPGNSRHTHLQAIAFIEDGLPDSRRTGKKPFFHGGRNHIALSHSPRQRFGIAIGAGNTEHTEIVGCNGQNIGIHPQRIVPELVAHIAAAIREMPGTDTHTFYIRVLAKTFGNTLHIQPGLGTIFLVGNIPVFVLLTDGKGQLIGVIYMKACRGRGGNGQDRQEIDDIPHQDGDDKQFEHDPQVETALCPY